MAETVYSGVDSITLSGNRSEYLITVQDGERIYLEDTVDGRDGTVVAYDVGSFEFADFTINSQLALMNIGTGSYNANSRSDFYWRYVGSDTSATDLVWEVESGNVFASLINSPTSLTSTAGVSIIDTSFYNHSSANAVGEPTDLMADYVVVMASSSEGIQFRAAGTADDSAASTYSVDMSSASYVGHGDFDGDNREDIFISVPTGTDSKFLYVYSGDTATTGGDRTQINGLPLGNEWNVLGIGDMNEDGKADILFRHRENGIIVQWFYQSSQGVPYEMNRGNPGDNWVVLGMQDFDGNGTDDILFRNSATKDVVQWATFVGSSRSFGDISGSYIGTVDDSWELLGGADFDGSGSEDLLWRHSTTGMVVNWLMDGSNSTGNLLSTSTEDTMELEGFGDYNGDGRADIAWRDSSSNLVTVWYMDGGTATSSVVGAIDNNYVLVT